MNSFLMVLNLAKAAAGFCMKVFGAREGTPFFFWPAMVHSPRFWAV